MIYLLFILSIFLHVWSDFYKQKWLAQAKCKSWWLEQEEATYIDATYKLPKIRPLYQKDYWGMLGAHSAHWAFCVMLPVLIYGICNTNNIDFFGFVAIIVFVINIILHSIIDNLKANVKIINLLQDQFFHLIQIILTIVVMGVVI